jgi:hypothetical protein
VIFVAFSKERLIYTTIGRNVFPQTLKSTLSTLGTTRPKRSRANSLSAKEQYGFR